MEMIRVKFLERPQSGTGQLPSIFLTDAYMLNLLQTYLTILGNDRIKKTRFLRHDVIIKSELSNLSNLLCESRKLFTSPWLSVTLYVEKMIGPDECINEWMNEYNCLQDTLLFWNMAQIPSYPSQISWLNDSSLVILISLICPHFSIHYIDLIQLLIISHPDSFSSS